MGRSSDPNHGYKFQIIIVIRNLYWCIITIFFSINLRIVLFKLITVFQSWVIFLQDSYRPRKLTHFINAIFDSVGKYIFINFYQHTLPEKHAKTYFVPLFQICMCMICLFLPIITRINYLVWITVMRPGTRITRFFLIDIRCSDMNGRCILTSVSSLTSSHRIQIGVGPYYFILLRGI